MKKIQAIKDLCTQLLESKDTINIAGSPINKQELIDWVRTKHEPRTITLEDALDVIRSRDLFQEVKRMLVDKDTSFDY